MSPFLLARRFVAQSALAMAVCISSLEPSFATEPGDLAPVRQALRTAWQQHPSYQATEAQINAARTRLDAAGQPLYNPELQLTRDNGGEEKTVSAGMNLTLDLSGKRRVRRDAADARLDLATAEAHLRRRDFARLWLIGWADLQATQLQVATGERRLALITRFSGLAEKQFTTGDISGLERDLALLARDEAQAEQAQWLADQAEAEAKFRSVGGNPDTIASFDLPAGGLPAPEPAGDLQALPDWQVAQATATATEREVAVARRNRVADPTVGVYGGRKEYRAGGPTDRVYGVTVTIPLFVRNSYRAEVVAAQAEADAAHAELQRVRLELEAERRRAVDSYAAARSAWSGWKRSRGTDVTRRADLLERSWRQGELSTTEYLLQLKQTLDTQLAGAKLQARVWRTYTDYLASSGRLEDWAALERNP
ncbi:MAG: TolC family protein [Rudaea sp.]|uniref:TolC family protein n=1 Tax=unclassified Rudaea TaxID=2627037 RepID=UPI0010FA5EA0|nr:MULTISPECIES: TolC family protein [unclassified Rudaea]MBN8888503.1 TolC family protein [Rudaea sp.]